MAYRCRGRDIRCAAFRPRRGASLLMTLLVTASMLATALNLATLVLVGLRRASTSAAALPPFYQAESGLERALFRIRQLQLLPSELNMANECDTNLTCGTADCMPGCTVNIAFTTSTPAAVAVSFPRLRKDQSVQIDLVDRTDDHDECAYDDGMGLSAAACIHGLRVYCKDLDGSPLGSLVFTVTKIGQSDGTTDTWLPGTEGVASQDVYDLTFGTDFRCLGTSNPHVLDSGIDINSSYTVKIRALYSDVEITNIVAYSNAALTSPVPLTSHLQLTAVGVGTGIRQQVRATLPGRLPVLGLTDFLIYSECGLEKTTLAPAYGCP